MGVETKGVPASFFKATVKAMQSEQEAVKNGLENIERRLANVEFASNGKLYREQTSEGKEYSKSIAQGILPYGFLDRFGAYSAPSDGVSAIVPLAGEIVTSVPTAIVSKKSDGTIIESKSIPASLISKYFPNGMKSAKNLSDLIDLENGVAITNIGSHVFSGIYIKSFGTASSGLKYVEYKAFSGIKIDTSKEINAITSDGRRVSLAANVDKSIRFMSGSFYLYDSGFTSLEDAESKIDGLACYFELSKPTSVAMDQADIDLLRSIHVEAGGTLVFENSGNAAIPNKETFFVKI